MMVFKKDANDIKTILQRNLFPSHLIDKVTTDYLDKKSRSNITNNINSDLVTKYFKLSFIGKYSSFAQRKVRFLSKRFCKNLDIKLVFSRGGRESLRFLNRISSQIIATSVTSQ